MGLFGRKKDTIDLRETVDLREPVNFVFGFPTRCPTCGDKGYLDHIDPFKQTQYEHCKGCGEKWALTEEEIATLA
jgi:competence transcription factor ComK